MPTSTIPSLLPYDTSQCVTQNIYDTSNTLQIDAVQTDCYKALDLWIEYSIDFTIVAVVFIGLTILIYKKLHHAN